MDVYHLGGVHGLYSLYERATEKYSVRAWKAIKLDGTRIQWFIQWSITMGVVLFSWVFFRADSLDSVNSIFRIVLNIDSFSLSSIKDALASSAIGRVRLIVIFVAILLLEVIQLLREKEFLFDFTTEYRLIFSSLLIWIIVLFGSFGLEEFIYFQF